jgi:chemotaxis protein methyltransferase CheR
MMAGRAPSATETVAMSDADFEAFARVIHAQTGIVMNESKRSMLVSRLSRRLRKLGLPDFAAYRRLLEAPGSDDERRELVSAITTNVTSFFREPVHFEALRALAPALAERTRHGQRVRIWSAGCSSGEEPYSIAMTLKEYWPDVGNADMRILATDIDPEMVAKARNGVFARPTNAPANAPILQKYMTSQNGDGSFAATADLKSLLRFEELNLLGPWPFDGMFDVIFCRNVVIYFDAETRLRLWRRFAERLHPGGTLFVGHSERVDAALERLLEPSGVTQYRRTKVPAGGGPTSGGAIQIGGPPQ